MLKILLFLLVLTLSSYTNDNNNTDKNTTNSLDIKFTIQNFINERVDNPTIFDSNVFIKNRIILPSSESFFAIVPTHSSVKSSDIPNNITLQKIKSHYLDLVNFTIVNDINYTKDSFSAVSSFVAFPQNSDKKKEDFLDALFKNKALTLYSSYKNYHYNLFFKDINASSDGLANIQTKNIKIEGVYNSHNLLSQKTHLLMEKIVLKVLEKNTTPVVDFRLENFKFTFDIKKHNNKIDIVYAFSLDLLENKIEKQALKMKNFNFVVKVGNLDFYAYDKMLKSLQDAPKMKEEELMMLGFELLGRSKNLYFEISDLSVEGVDIASFSLGKFEINSMIKLTNTQDLMQNLMVSPLSALSSIEANFFILFNESLLKEMYKQKREVASFVSLFAEHKEDNLIFDIRLKKSIITINNRPLDINGLLAMKQMSQPQKAYVQPTQPYIEPKKVPLTKHSQKYQQNALHQAVLSKNIEEVKSLLKNINLEVNSKDKLGRTALHYAVFNGDMEMTKLLLLYKADIDAVDSAKEWTPLFFAVFMKHTDITNFLIKKGANIILKDKLGRTIEAYQK